MIYKLFLGLLAACLLLACSGGPTLDSEGTAVAQPADPLPVQTATPSPSPTPDPFPAFTAARRLGRGVNLGNALEAPREGEWGLRLNERFFEVIAEAGFDSVRLPIKWSAHAAEESPYTIDEEFFERIDWAIDQAFSQDLAIVINVHHYDEIMVEPEAHQERLNALWRQIATRYQDYPHTLYFEILNEPHNQLQGELWNDILNAALQVIRETNPTRPVIVGPDTWNNLQRLPQLRLPEDDDNLIVTFHFYEPFEFTHQGAEWVGGAHEWLGRRWEGSPVDTAQLQVALDDAAEWAAANGRPLYLGEFGAYQKAEMADRVAWTTFVRSEAEARDISWAYWEFGAGFGIYEPPLRRWREDLLGALIPES